MRSLLFAFSLLAIVFSCNTHLLNSEQPDKSVEMINFQNLDKSKLNRNSKKVIQIKSLKFSGDYKGSIELKSKTPSSLNLTPHQLIIKREGKETLIYHCSNNHLISFYTDDFPKLLKSFFLGGEKKLFYNHVSYKLHNHRKHNSTKYHWATLNWQENRNGKVSINHETEQITKLQLNFHKTSFKNPKTKTKVYNSSDKKNLLQNITYDETPYSSNEQKWKIRNNIFDNTEYGHSLTPIEQLPSDKFPFSSNFILMRLELNGLDFLSAFLPLVRSSMLEFFDFYFYQNHNNKNQKIAPSFSYITNTIVDKTISEKTEIIFHDLETGKNQSVSIIPKEILVDRRAYSFPKVIEVTHLDSNNKKLIQFTIEYDYYQK